MSNKEPASRNYFKYLVLLFLLVAAGVFLYWRLSWQPTDDKIIGTWTGIDDDKGLIHVYTFNRDGTYYYYNIKIAVLETSSSPLTQGIFYIDKNILSFHPAADSFKIILVGTDKMVCKNLKKGSYITWQRINLNNYSYLLEDRGEEKELKSEEEGAKAGEKSRVKNETEIEELKNRAINAYYPFRDVGRKKLVNGCCEYIEEDPSWAGGYKVLLAKAEEAVGFGDINHDGFTDAVIALQENYGGNVYFANIYAYFDYGDGKYKTVHIDDLFMCVKVNQIKVSGSEITVDYLTLAPDQSKIEEYKLFVSATYVFRDGKFKREKEISRDLRYQ